MLFNENDLIIEKIESFLASIKYLTHKNKDRFIQENPTLYNEVENHFCRITQFLKDSIERFRNFDVLDACKIQGNNSLIFNNQCVTIEEIQKETYVDLDLKTPESQKYCLNFMMYLINYNIDSIRSNYLFIKEISSDQYLDSMLQCLNNIFLQLSISTNISIEDLHKTISILNEQITKLYNEYIEKTSRDHDQIFLQALIQKYYSHYTLKKELLMYTKTICLNVNTLISLLSQKVQYTHKSDNNSLVEHLHKTKQIVQQIYEQEQFPLYEEKDGFLWFDGEKIIINGHSAYQQHISFFCNRESVLHTFKSRKISLYCFHLKLQHNILKHFHYELHNELHKNKITISLSELEKKVILLNELMLDQNKEYNDNIQQCMQDLHIKIDNDDDESYDEEDEDHNSNDSDNNNQNENEDEVDNNNQSENENYVSSNNSEKSQT
ncbi:hypothetical protein AB837_00583 [bacterium AB1]|nr:hypothetical protein AB837_00583 [bacterium AB1]